MRRLVLAFVSLTGAALAHAQTAQTCASLAAPRALPVQPTVLAPIAPGLVTPSHQLGAPTGVLADAFDESRSVDQVLFRLQLEQCRSVAAVTPAVTPAAVVPGAPVVPGATPAPTSADPAAYQPKTEFDNSPWRFDMNQNGKRMTADEFAAWMESKGVRVARGAGAAAPAAPAADGATPTPAKTETPATIPDVEGDE